MTSGTFQSVPLSSIWVDRDKRQRRVLTDIPELADSIKRTGLIHPPVIRRSGELVVGERRLEAMRLLGWTACPVQFIDELNEHELRVVELEENVRRKELPWQDQCLSVNEYHELRLAENPKWDQVMTAEALGVSPQDVAHKRSVAKELKSGNERVAAAPLYSTARNIVQRDKERRLASIAPVAAQLEVPLLHADFHEWAQTYLGEPFNLIHCDFPYGIDADKFDLGPGGQAQHEHGTYADTEEEYIELIGTLLSSMGNVIADSAHLIFWFSMKHYNRTMEEFISSGWRVDPFPLVWHKSDGSGVIPDPSRGPRRIYETALFASRGDRKIVKSKGNAVSLPMSKTVHVSEKPVAVVKHFMEIICDEYSTVLDPTAGSGNALRAAKSLGAARILGLERDSAIHSRAVEAWRQAEAGNGEGG